MCTSCWIVLEAHDINMTYWCKPWCVGQGHHITFGILCFHWNSIKNTFSFPLWLPCWRRSYLGLCCFNYQMFWGFPDIILLFVFNSNFILLWSENIVLMILVLSVLDDWFMAKNMVYLVNVSCRLWNNVCFAVVGVNVL